ncbi:MAG TPA: hypothetical protein VKV73_29680 [Chloroflexota bacterium]|nr:hypothetical protein [Chloroflexota bacterium]
MSLPLDATDRPRLHADLDTPFLVDASAGTGKTRDLRTPVR